MRSARSEEAGGRGEGFSVGEAAEGGRGRNLVSAPVRSHLSTGRIYVCVLTHTRTIDCM